jgi:hypothetical protein
MVSRLTVDLECLRDGLVVCPMFCAGVSVSVVQLLKGLFHYAPEPLFPRNTCPICLTTGSLLLRP